MIKVLRFGRYSYARAPWSSDTHTVSQLQQLSSFSGNFQVFFSCHDGFLVGECAEIRNRDSVLPEEVGCCSVTGV